MEEIIIGNFYNDSKININNWGPSYWYVIHMMAINYKPQNYKQTYYFYKFLTCILPCAVCQSPVDGYPYYFKTHDITSYLDNNKKLFEWTYNLHNYVNKKTNKQNFPLSVFQTYNLFKSLDIKYNLFLNFLINLSQICTKFDKKEKCTQINHIILNILFIIKNSIPELGQYVYLDNIVSVNCAKESTNIIKSIAITIKILKENSMIDVNSLESRILKTEKCYQKKKCSISK